MNILREFFEQKETPVGPAIVRALGPVHFRKHDLVSLAKEGFSENVTVYACVMKYGQALSGIPWVLYRRGRGTGTKTQKIMTASAHMKGFALGQRYRSARKAVELAEVEDHPLLRLLEKPNPRQGGGVLIEQLVAFWFLTGNSYLTAVGPKVGPPRELYVLRPDRTEVVPGDGVNELVAGYVYKVGSEEQPFPAAAILHLKMFNPLDDWYGLSPVAVAARSIDTDNEALKWNYSLLRNEGRPAGAFVTAQPLTDPQRDRMRKQLKEKYSGWQNAGKPLLLEAGLDYKTITLSPQDMGWATSRKMSKREICQAIGVAPELIGDQENKTYSNYAEARTAFYQEGVLPAADRLRDDLNNWLTPRFGDNLRLDYDKDQIEALQEDQQKLWTRIETSSSLTVNEKREALGYDEYAPGAKPKPGDVILVASSLVPLEQAVAEPEPVPDALAFGKPGQKPGADQPKPGDNSARPPAQEPEKPEPAPPAAGEGEAAKAIGIVDRVMQKLADLVVD